MTQPKFTLHQFEFSNYCEKARWAFDFKGLDPHRRNYLPFLHASTINKLSGQTAVPIVESKEGVVVGSTPILERLQKVPTSQLLFPKDPAEHQQVQQWLARLDEAGATVRGALFSDAIEAPGFMLKLFTTGRNRLTASAYGLMFRLMLPKMKRLLRERVPDPDQLRVDLNRLLDEVAEVSSTTGYLIGNRFSAADLAAAALFYPLFFPNRTPGAAAVKGSPIGRAWLKRWENSAARSYVLTQYERHRFRTVQ